MERIACEPYSTQALSKALRGQLLNALDSQVGFLTQRLRG